MHSFLQIRQHLIGLLNHEVFRSLANLSERKGKTESLILWTAGQISKRHQPRKCSAQQKCSIVKVQLTQAPINATVKSWDSYLPVYSAVTLTKEDPVLLYYSSSSSFISSSEINLPVASVTASQLCQRQQD